MPRLPRSSGILLHPTSLPGPHGIGDLASAWPFLDFLERAGQRLWQVLPLTPTGFGDSPYAAPSAFAGNPLLVALGSLVERGWLDDSAAAVLQDLPTDRVDYAALVPRKHAALRSAYEGFTRLASAADRERFEEFRHRERDWLDDYCLFVALRDEQDRDWSEWDPPLRDREPAALAGARERLAERLDRCAFVQYLFFEQWQAVRADAQRRGIRLVGDIPIFVAHDSVDVWANRSLFKLGPSGRPTVVAGVPPDYFSRTGQLWGNPHYDWDASTRDGHGWWAARFRHLLRLVDVIRIDHFRGFQAAWEVSADAETAVEGAWAPGPGADLFRTIDRSLGLSVPVIAEDLGLITDDVRHLLAEVGYPGMKVLQFAFSGPDNLYLPHAYEDPNWVVYTGTHDNDTTRGWYASLSESERSFARRYAGISEDDAAWDLIRLAESTVADTAILPLQDVLDLGPEARMNTPGTSSGNWTWRVRAEQLRDETAHRLGDLTWTYGRGAR